MGLSLPFSRNRRYLVGVDWVVGMFDYILKRRSGAGNAFLIILHLDRPVSEQELRDSFGRFAAHFPLLHGRPSRDWTLAPYWKIPPPRAFPPVRLDVQRFGVDTPTGAILCAMADRANDPFRGDSEHVALSLVNAGDSRSFIGFHMDHRLFDARGAEGFLDLFQQFCSGKNPDAPTAGISFTEPAHLSNWLAMFKAGQRVNRSLLALRDAAHVTFDYSALTDYRTHFRFATFDEDQSRKIIDQAYASAGYLMLMPYLLAAGALALHRVFLRKGLKIPDYIIPASFDMRRPNTLREKAFFNHVSFIFFRVPATAMERPRELMSLIRQQFYDSNKSGLLHDFYEASHLMRILPPSILARLARLPLKDQFGSFSFAHVGNTTYRSPAFLNANVLNLYHAPRVPVPPGLGFFFNTFRGQLNLTLSYLPELLDDQDMEAVITDLGKLPSSDLA